MPMTVGVTMSDAMTIAMRIEVCSALMIPSSCATAKTTIENSPDWARVMPIRNESAVSAPLRRATVAMLSALTTMSASTPTGMTHQIGRRTSMSTWSPIAVKNSAMKMSRMGLSCPESSCRNGVEARRNPAMNAPSSGLSPSDEVMSAALSAIAAVRTSMTS